MTVIIRRKQKGTKDMEKIKKDINVSIGKRLREIRKNMQKRPGEIAELLGITEDHYRKLESGTSGLSGEKLMLLYSEYGIDPTYLITGNNNTGDFDVDSYIINSNNEERSRLVERVFAYVCRVMNDL